MTSYYERVLKGKTVTQIEPIPLSFITALLAVSPETNVMHQDVRCISWRATPEVLHYFQNDRPSFHDILECLQTYYGFPPGGMLFFGGEAFSWLFKETR